MARGRRAKLWKTVASTPSVRQKISHQTDPIGTLQFIREALQFGGKTRKFTWHIGYYDPALTNPVRRCAAGVGDCVTCMYLKKQLSQYRLIQMKC